MNTLTKLGVEGLDRRDVPAVLNAYIDGTPVHNLTVLSTQNQATHVQISQVGSSVIVRDTDTQATWQFVKGTFSQIVMYGSNADDTLASTVSGVGVRAYGFAGNDQLYAYGGGTNVLDGGDGDDWIIGGSGVDVMYGGRGNDYLFATDGNDKLYGDGGNDTLWGGNGNDYLDGGLGNDALHGGAGADVLDGGYERFGVNLIDTGVDNDVDVVTVHWEHVYLGGRPFTDILDQVTQAGANDRFTVANHYTFL